MKKDKTIRILGIPLYKRTIKKGELKIHICGIRIKKTRLNPYELLSEGYYDLNYVPNFSYSENKQKNILIIKTDSIGDYVIMRNFWEEIRHSEKYKNAKITLILSSAMKGVAEFLDEINIEKFFYVPHPFWKKSTQEKALVLSELFKQGLQKHYDTILFPNLNRVNYEDFNILVAQHISANEKIISLGDIDINNFDNMEKNYLFTQVISDYNSLLNFEFNSNKYFFEKACEHKIKLPIHHIDLPKKNNGCIVINPSSQEKMKMWHGNNWIELIKKLIQKYHKEIVLIGSKEEFDTCHRIQKYVGEDFCSLAINRPFSEIIPLINNADLFIGNDSACFHISVSCKTKAICIAGGAGYQRFTNYPESPLYKVVLAPETKHYIEEHNISKEKMGLVGAVNSVTVTQVFETAKELLTKS